MHGTNFAYFLTEFLNLLSVTWSGEKLVVLFFLHF